MIQNPSRDYSGLTIITELSRHSRAHGKHFTGIYEKELIENALLRAGMSISTCQVRTVEDTEPLLAGTKCVLALGESVIRELYPQVTLGEQRGAPLKLSYDVEIFGHGDIPTIFSYSPQEASDRQKFEQTDADFDDGEDDVEESVQAIKSHGRTRRKNWRFWLKADIRKAVRITKEGLRVKEPRIKICTLEDAENIIHILRTTRGETLYFDIETEDNLQMTCFGFAFSEEQVYVVPMCQTHNNNEYFFGERTYEILHALGVALLANTVVIHNSMFDLFVTAWRYGIPVGSRVFDTLLAHSRNFIEVERSLGHCLSYYTDLPYHKNEGFYKPWNEGMAQQLYLYNGKDVYALTQLKPAIEKEAASLGASENVYLVNREVIPYLTTELRGINVNWAELNRVVEETVAKKDKLLLICHALAGYKINPGSPDQIKKYLYSVDGCGLKCPKDDPTNVKTLWRVLANAKKDSREAVEKAEKVAAKSGLSLSEEEKDSIQLQHDIPLIPWVIKYRQMGKIASRKEDGSIGGHLGFNGWEGCPVWRKFPVKRFTTQYGFSPVTFRRNSRAIKLFDGSKFGSNGQNWSKDLRHILIPAEGKSFIQIDEDGADARCVAWLCRHGDYRELFLAGIKPHTFVALHLFKDEWKKYFPPATIDRICGTAIKQLRADPDFKAVESFIKATDESTWYGMKYYFLGKKICHAASYGMGAQTFRLNVLAETEGTMNLSFAEAKHFLEFFFKLFPEILEWQASIRKEIDSKRMLRNMFGHPRFFTSFYTGDAYREAYAFKPQSTVGQIIAMAVCELQERVDSGDELLNTGGYEFNEDGHDAGLFSAFTPMVNEIAATIQPHINRTVTNERGESFIMKSGLQIGKNWGMA